MVQGTQRGLKIWFRDEIQNTLVAVDMANLDLFSSIDSPEMQMYRRGYVAAMRAVAAAFGLSYSPHIDQMQPQVVESPAWTRVLS
jgi:hypothetical protein